MSDLKCPYNNINMNETIDDYLNQPYTKIL